VEGHVDLDHGCPSEGASCSSSVDVRYRDFAIGVTASCRKGRIFVISRLTGGPDGVARKFGAPSVARDTRSACNASVAELQAMVDDLLAERLRNITRPAGNAAAAPR
jgi:hypothetical protein